MFDDHTKNKNEQFHDPKKKATSDKGMSGGD
jgi:hypothetical protein